MLSERAPTPRFAALAKQRAGRPNPVAYPGPRFAEILSAVEEAQLEGAIATREEAMNFVERNFDRQ